jgi:hypothetical protein
MSHAVDAVGGPRDHRETAIAESGRQLHRHVLAVVRGIAGADDGDEPRRMAEGAEAPPDPERQRRVPAEVVEPLRPVRGAGDDEPSLEPRRRGESGHHRPGRKPRSPPVECGGDLGLGDVRGVLRAESGEEIGRRAALEQEAERAVGPERRRDEARRGVAGFGDRRPGRGREHPGGLLVVVLLDGRRVTVVQLLPRARQDRCGELANEGSIEFVQPGHDDTDFRR